MLQEELSLRGSGGGGNSSSSRWKKTMTGARVCDSCRSSSSTVYCRADGSYLCTGCDSRVHGTACGGGDHHERVWVCESCQRAPADFLCKADAASLCAACDSYIHSANSLASRHHRVVILPTTFFNNSRNPVSAGGRRVLMGENHHEDRRLFDDEEEADSWLLLDNNCNGSKGGDDYNNDQNSNNGCSSSFLGAEVDDYLDLVEYNLICGDENEKPEYKRSSYIGGDDHHDSMVPMGEAKQEQELHIFELGLGYELNNKSYTHPPPNYQAAGYNNNSNNTSNLSHSLSASSMDVGVVPVETTTSSSTHHHDMTITLYSSVNPALQVLPAQPLSPVDREARVLRYREKKKTRKFEKTIRYASRKAYAETRPRIKGRFAKRVDVEVDRMFADTSSMMMQEDGNVGCGVVPSF